MTERDCNTDAPTRLLPLSRTLWSHLTRERRDRSLSRYLKQRLSRLGGHLPSPLSPKIAVSAVFVLAMFMTIMDITIVNVALPTLASEFHVRPDHVDSVVVGFLVSLAVFIPASSWLGDRFGTKRIFLLALVLFTGASALSRMDFTDHYRSRYGRRCAAALGILLGVSASLRPQQHRSRRPSADARCRRPQQGQGRRPPGEVPYQGAWRLLTVLAGSVACIIETL